MNSQTKRLKLLFESNPNVEIGLVELHRVGSGSPYGFCSSLSRRISDLRETGLNIQKTTDVRVDGQRRTRYTNVVDVAQNN